MRVRGSMTRRKKKKSFFAVATVLIERFFSYMVALTVFALLIAEVIAELYETETLVALGIIAIYTVGRLAYLGYVFVRGEDKRLPFLRAFEAPVLLLALLHLLIAITGGILSPLNPLIYFAIAVFAVFCRFPVAVFALALAIAAAVAFPALKGELTEHAWVVGAQVIFILIFASLRFMLSYLEGMVQRFRADLYVDRVLGDIEWRAKQFRRLSARKPEHIEDDHDEKRNLASYFEIQDTLQEILHILALAQKSFTCAALWLDEDGKNLRVVEAYSFSEKIHGDPYPYDEDALVSVVRSGQPLRLTCSAWTKNQLGYYSGKEPLFSVAAVPIMDDGVVRGILAIDRAEAISFSDEDIEMLEMAGGLIRHSLINENNLRQLNKSQAEYLLLAQASKTLSEPLEMEDVLEVSFRAMHGIAAFDFAAIVMIRPMERDYEVVACWPEGEATGLLGATFHGEVGLVDWVVRNQKSLVRHDLRNLPRPPTIFCRGEKLENLASLMIAPLYVSSTTNGALVFISNESEFFTEHLQHIFEIMANQIAVSLENARMVKELERLAITDSLTGLYNKRYFYERIAEIMSRAERYEQELAVMMIDLDRFKKINDTYGHPAGDFVLREVSRTLRESLRKIDLLARFGGEEFVVVLDGSDAEKALDKAEELRERVSELRFETERGEFRIHISVGIALFPEDSRQHDELLGKADTALYHSKRSGRNRTSMFKDL